MKQINSLLNQLLLVRGGKWMLRRFIFLGNRSHAGISSNVSAFCVFRAGGRQWPPSASLGALIQGTGQEGNKVTLLPWHFPCYLDSTSLGKRDWALFLPLLLSFRALTLSITWLSLQAQLKEANNQHVFPIRRKWSILCPKAKEVGV